MNPFSFNQNLYEDKYSDPGLSNASGMRKMLFKNLLTKLNPKPMAIIVGRTVAVGLVHKGIVALTQRRGNARRSRETSSGPLNAVAQQEETANSPIDQEATEVPERERCDSCIAPEGHSIDDAASDVTRSLSCLQNGQLSVDLWRAKVTKEAGTQTVPLHEKTETQTSPVARYATFLAEEPGYVGQYVGSPPISHCLAQQNQQARTGLFYSDGNATPPFIYDDSFFHCWMFNPTYAPPLLPDFHNFLTRSHYENYNPVPCTLEDEHGSCISLNTQGNSFFPHPVHTNPCDYDINGGASAIHRSDAKLQGTMDQNAQLIQEERASSPLARCDAPLNSPQPAVKKPLNPSTPPFVPRKGNESAVKQAFCTVDKSALNPCSPPFEPGKTEVNAVVSVNQEAS